MTTLAAACGPAAQPPGDAAPSDAGRTEEWFVDRAAESGLDFVHASGMSGRFYQPEISGGGVALFDYDNDGDLDVLLVQGGALGADAPAPRPGGKPLRDRLYRNDLEVRADGTPSLRFTDVTDASGIATRGYGQGVASGDIDNDGWPDLYLTGFGRNQMFRNNGDGTFTDVSAATGTGSPDTWGVSATFFDADRDGWLDLFVGNYLIYTVPTHIRCFRESGQEDYCTPERYPPQRDRFYRNRGDGSFEEATVAAGLADEFGPALGASTADFDGDGWTDLFVANDQRENQLWMNRGDGTFVNRALLAGAAVDAAGVAKADMGVDAGDFDNDGDEDVFTTVLTGEGSTLYVNDGTGLFEDRSAASGVRAASLPYTGWGAGWLDADNDGWLDLLSVNGLVWQDLDALAPDNPYPYQQRNQLLRNLGDGRFEDVTARAGAAFDLSAISRGAGLRRHRQRRRRRRPGGQRGRPAAPARQLHRRPQPLAGPAARRPRRPPRHGGGACRDHSRRRGHAVAPRAGRRQLRVGERPPGPRRARQFGHGAARPRPLAERSCRGMDRPPGRPLHDARGGRRAGGADGRLSGACCGSSPGVCAAGPATRDLARARTPDATARSRSLGAGSRPVPSPSRAGMVKLTTIDATIRRWLSTSRTGTISTNGSSGSPPGWASAGAGARRPL